MRCGVSSASATEPFVPQKGGHSHFLRIFLRPRCAVRSTFDRTVARVRQHRNQRPDEGPVPSRIRCNSSFCRTVQGGFMQVVTSLLLTLLLAFAGVAGAQEADA